MSERQPPSTVFPTLVAALAVLLSSSAFSGVLADPRWLPGALLVVGVVAGTGLAGRTLRWWPPLVVLAQLAAVLVVLVVLFSKTLFMSVVPGTAAVRELAGVLSSGLDIVRNGIPPVEAGPAIQCLVCLGLGLVAVLVDAVAVTVGAPAVAGLVLLCVFAIPASLADEMLPWGSFVAGAVAFTALLVTGGSHRRRNTSLSAHQLFGPNLAAVVGVSTVLALLAGVLFTGVGTRGRLPGDDQSASANGGIGLRPFTSLRGQLNRDQVVELFRVRGLPRETYLRAMTLRKFDPQRGWRLDGLTSGVDASKPLPVPEGTDVQHGIRARVEIEPVSYRDPWLPVFGVPTKVDGMGENWRYDSQAGIVFTQTRQDSRPYTESMILPNPPAERLRTATGPVAVDPAYLDTSGVAPQIGDLARRLTANEPTNFDKAVALNRYFTDPSNGFVYDLRTAPPQGNNALVDFLFHGKRGFCEQYSSSMAVLLREIGIPSRVAVGFTAGYPDGDQQVITTNDAHAWVEAYFPGSGWITFDPTPLDDRRTSTPQYLAREQLPGQPPPGDQGPQNPPPDQPPGDRGQAQPPRPSRPDSGGGLNWSAFTAGLLLLAAIAAAPAGYRTIRRGQRLRTVAEGGPGAGGAAWAELLDEWNDRGSQPVRTDTVRTTAAKMADAHQLDAGGTAALHELVSALEREWYAPGNTGVHTEVTSVREALDTVLASLHRCSPLGWRDRLLPRSALERVRAHRMLGGGSTRSTAEDAGK